MLMRQIALLIQRRGFVDVSYDEAAVIVMSAVIDASLLSAVMSEALNKYISVIELHT